MTDKQNPVDTNRPRSGREIALNVGAIAGLICVLAALASLLLGIKPLVFRSGSMSPEISTGSLALAKTVPASELSVGDVVSVVNDQGTRITHRVHEIVSANGDSSVVILKGDANTDADITPYTVTEVDRVFFSVPGLGYAVSWLSSPMAIFLGGGLVGAVMVLAFGQPAKRKDDDDSNTGNGGGVLPGAHEAIEKPAQHAHDGFEPQTQQIRVPSFSLSRRTSARTVMGAGALSLAVMVGMTTGTSAAFTDSGVAAGSYSSRKTTLPAPKYLGCTTGGGNGSVTIKWEHLGPGYTYEIQTEGGYYATISSPALPANKGDTVTKTISAYNEIYKTAKNVPVRIRSIRDGVKGTAYVGENVWASAIASIWCNGSISAWSNAGEAPLARGAAPEQELTADAPTEEGSAKNPTSTEPVTTAPTTTTETTTETTTTTEPTTTAEPTTTTPPGATPPTTTTTAPTKPVLTNAVVAPSGMVTAGKSADGKSVMLVDSNGELLADGAIDPSATLQWEDGKDVLWIVGAGKVNRIMKSPQDGTWKFYLDGGQLPPGIGGN